MTKPDLVLSPAHLSITPEHLRHHHDSEGNLCPQRRSCADDKDILSVAIVTNRMEPFRAIVARRGGAFHV